MPVTCDIYREVCLNESTHGLVNLRLFLLLIVYLLALVRAVVSVRRPRIERQVPALLAEGVSTARDNEGDSQG